MTFWKRTKDPAAAGPANTSLAPSPPPLATCDAVHLREHLISPRLLECSLPESHGGDHYDDWERLHWRRNGAAVIMTPRKAGS